jgi:hypothetical protein
VQARFRLRIWRAKKEVAMKRSLRTLLIPGALFVATTAFAQTPESPELTACKATGLIALQQRSPSVKQLILDMDTLTFSKANTDIEGIPVKEIVMGDAYLERKQAGAAQHFLCIIGDKGKVLLTFFGAP